MLCYTELMFITSCCNFAVCANYCAYIYTLHSVQRHSNFVFILSKYFMCSLNFCTSAFVLPCSIVAVIVHLLPAIFCAENIIIFMICRLISVHSNIGIISICISY